MRRRAALASKLTRVGVQPHNAVGVEEVLLRDVRCRPRSTMCAARDDNASADPA